MTKAVPFLVATLAFAVVCTFGQVAQVRHAPTLNGTVEGSVQQMLPESVTLNGGATVTLDLFVPGAPTVRLNGQPNYGGTIDGSGAATPTNYQITLNGNSALRHVVRRTNAAVLPSVGTVPTPTGTVALTVSTPGATINWSTLRHLTLNGGVGQFAVPPGTYGDFIANGGSGFTLGVAGATTPSVYNFQHLTLNGSARFDVVGPIVVNLANGFTANGTVGAAGRPAWLTLNIASGGLTLNGGVNFHGYVLAPAGTVIVNGTSVLVGGVTSDRLLVNGGGVLRLQSAQAPNQPPTVAITSPGAGTVFNSPASFVLAATATDSDGTIAKVEFFQDATKIGEDTTAPFSAPVSNLGVGDYAFTARATDNAGATVTSAAVPITVASPNVPPTVALTAPAEGSSFTAPATIPLSASATDSDGTVAKVEFLQDGAKIGESTTAPFNFLTAALPVGTYVFAARAIDNAGAVTTSAPVSVTVIHANAAPVVAIVAPAAGAVYDAPATFTLQASASDSDGTIAKVEFFRDATKLGEALTPPYALALSGLPVGSYNFIARATDNLGTSTDSVGVTVSVALINDAPVATAQSLATAEDTGLPLTLAANDPDGDALSFAIVGGPQHGTLTGTPPNLVYVPAANFSGSDSFTFTASDATLTSAPATVSLAVSPVNDRPVANGFDASLPEDTSTPLTLSGADVEGSALSFLVLTPPQHGALSGAAPALTYTPAANFTGPDSFTYAVNDGDLTSVAATVTLNVTPVNDAPSAQAASYTVHAGTPLPLTLVGSDADGDALTFAVTQAPQHGTLSGAAPTLTYTPAQGFSGSDSFAFTVNDGIAASSAATVAITVANTIPAAQGQAVVASEDTPKPVSLAAVDADGDALTYEITVPPAHGSLAGVAPNLTYTPASDYHGPDEFAFRVGDGVAFSPPALVEITVESLNDLPVALSFSRAASEGSSVDLTLEASDADGDPLTFTVLSPPAHGTLSGTPPALSYRPNDNFGGTDSFTYKANDGTADSNVATVTLTVTDLNRAPTADAQDVTALEDTPQTVTLTGSDPDQDALTFTVTQQPAHGVLTGSAPNLIYTPHDNFSGNDSFRFTVSDGAETSSPAVISLHVAPVNDAPVAAPSEVAVTEDVPAEFVPVAGDPDGDPITYTIVTPPAHGTIAGSIAGLDPQLTYTPAPNFHGTDSLVFKVSDGALESAPAEIRFTVAAVNDTPAGSSFTVPAVEDTAAAFALVGTDADGDPVTFQITSAPAHGTLAVVAGNCVYTPALNFNGADSFTYVVSDGSQQSGPYTVTIAVAPVNDAPVANAGAASTLEDNGIALILTGTDVEGDALGFRIVTPPAHGTLTGSGENWFYTPGPNYNGSDSFVFVANDGQLDSAPGTFTLDVTPVNDAPVAAVQALTSPEDAVLPVTLGGSDVDGDTLTFVVTTPPQHGTLAGSGRDLVYTPAPDYNGPDAFAFTVSDGSLTSTPASVALTITPVNDPPVATPAALVTDEDVPAPFTLAGTDVDGDALTFAIATPPAHGTLSGTAPNLVYTPAPNFNGTDSFTFTAHDGTVTSEPATVAVTINSVNDAPTAEAQTLTTAEDTPSAVTLTGADVDGDALSFVVTQPPAHGTLSGAAPSLTYTPAPNYHGADSFRFVASDGALTSAETAVAITVTPVNDAPVATPATYATTTGQPLPLVLAGTDVDGDALTFTVLTQPARGTLTGTPPNLVYTSAPDFGGFDSFTFRASDGTLNSAPATVQLTAGLPPRSRTYTTTADFAEGTQFSLSTETPDQLTNKIVLSSFDAVWVANSQKGTVVKIDPDTGRVIGEFLTKPANSATTPYPSRVAVDSKGNVWVANYSDNSLVKIGVPENGYWVDRNGNGQLDTSGALGDVLAWDADNVAAASDEAILLYVRTNVPGVRHLSVDASDNVWVGGAGGSWQKFNGATGELMRTEPNIGVGGQGGFIAPDGRLFSAGAQFLIWQTANPVDALPESNSIRDGAWASALDSKGNLWVTKDWTSTVVKYAPDGTKLGEYYHGEPWAMGIAIDAEDHVWVAHSHCGHSVGHLLNDGTLIGNVEVANHGPVEVSIDRRGRIWVVSSTGVVERINPLGGPLGSDGQTPVGVVDTTTGNLGGALWTYGRFTGSSTALASPEGRWTIVHDGQLTGTTWGAVVWDALLCNDGNIIVEAALSADGVTFGAWQQLTYANPAPSGAGRFLKVRTRLVSATTGEPPVLYSVAVGTAGYAPPTIAPSWTVAAGADIEGNWPDAIQLKGAFCHSAHDFPTAPTYAWSVVSGPSTVTFDNPASPRPKTQFGGVGTYVLRLSATLDGVTRTDDVTVSLTPYNRPPYVNAGYTTFRADVPPQLWLWGTVRDDGLPTGAAVTSTWSKLFGPGTVTFNDPAAASTTASFSAPGVYVLKLSASDSALTSTDVTTVWLGYACIPVAPDGLVSWWQASANGDDHVGGNQAFTERGTDYTDGKIGGAFRFDALNDRVRVFAAPSLDVGVGDTAGFALELWVNPNAARTATIFEYSSGTTRGFNLRQVGNRVEADFREANNTAHVLGVDGALPANTWTHVAATYDRVSGEARLYVNGALRVSQSVGSFTLRTNLDVNFGGQTANAESYGGLLDEISVYNRAIYPDEITAIYSHPAGKRPPVANVAPVVDAGPTLYNRTANTVVPLNGSVTDDGQPVDGVLTTKWTKLSGPGVVNFASDTSPQTTATFSEGGIYLLELEADDGGFCSRATVEVRVDALYKVEPDPATLGAWWPFNKDDVDVIRGLKMERFNGAALTADGRAARGLALDGVDDFGVVRAASATDIGASAAGLTIEMWAKPTQVGADKILLQWISAAGRGVAVGQFDNGGRNLNVNFRDTNGTDHGFEVGNYFAANTWVHIAATYDRATGYGRIYRNGVLVLEQSLGFFTPRTNLPLQVGAENFPNRTSFFQGTLDEITLYSRPLTITEIAAIYNAGVIGKALPDDNAAPLVNAGPDVAVSDVGVPATLNGQVSDDGRPAGATLSISWSKVDGPGSVSFGDATAAATTATFSQSGVYVLRLDANDGLNQAAGDLVTVYVGGGALEPQPTPPLAAWWPANGTPVEVVHGNAPAELYNGATYATGEVAQGFSFDGTNDFARVPAHADHDIGASAAGLTIEMWAKPTQVGADKILLQWISAAGRGVAVGQFDNGGRNLNVNFRDTNGTDHGFEVGNYFAANTWVHIAATYDRATGYGRIYRNGVLMLEQNLGVFTPRTNLPLQIGAENFPTTTSHFQGILDEITLYTRPLSITEIATIYAAGATGKTPPDSNTPPVVDAGPDVLVPATNATATLAGVVTDDNRPFGAPQITWSVANGPGSVQFADSSAANTTATFSAAGTYLLKLTASDGYTAPVSDYVEVRVNGATISPPSALAAWWPANGTPVEVVHGNAPAELYNGATYATGEVAQGFSFDGTNDFARVPAHADHDIGASAAGLTIEMWAKPTQVGADKILLQWISAAGRGVAVGQFDNGGRNLNVNFRDINGTDHGFEVGNYFAANTWVHIAATYDRATGYGRIYRNGVLMLEQNLGVFTPRTNLPLQIGAENFPTTTSHFQGILDEITLYTRPLTITEIAAVYAAGASGKTLPNANTAPVVDAGPDAALPDTATAASLLGSVVDDDRPAPVTTLWSVQHGPTGTTFADAAAPVTTATFTNPGTYLLRLTAQDGAAAPVTDVTEVRVGVRALEPVADIAAWWTGNGHGREVVHGNAPVELYNGATHAAGFVSQGFSFDGTDDYGRIPAHADHDIGASTAGLTIEMWAKPTQVGADKILLQWISAAGRGVAVGQFDNGGRNLNVNFRDINGTDHGFEVGNYFAANTWVHIAATYDRTTGYGRIYRNGVLMLEQNLGVFTPRTNLPLQIGAENFPTTTSHFQGILDEITLYTRPLTITEIAAIYAAGADGKAPPDSNVPPTVSAGPDVALAGTGETAILNGSVVDDQRPFGAPVATWSLVQGPGSVVFGNPGSAATTATFSAAGTYLLQLSGSDRFSAPVADLMEVRVGVAPLSPASGLAAWWPANGHPREIVHGNTSVEFYNGAGYDVGQVLQGFAFDGSNDFGRVPAHADHDVGASAAGMTIEFWARPTQVGADKILLQWVSAAGRGVTVGQFDNGGRNLNVNFRDLAGADHGMEVGNLFAANTWVHVAATYDRTTGLGRIYKNGVLALEQSLGVFTPRTNLPLQLAAENFPAPTSFYQGVLDELTLYGRPLSAAEVSSIYTAGAVGKLPPVQNAPPAVVLDTPTANASAVVDTPLTLSAIATDTDGTIAKVEFYDGAAKLGESTASDAGQPARFSFSLPTGLPLGPHTLSARATDAAGGTATSSLVTVNIVPVLPVVALTAPLEGASLATGAPVTLTADATYSAGAVTKVEFYDGLAKLGEATAPASGSTYSIAVTSGLTAGAHRLTARAYASASVFATSAPVNITAAVVLPIVSLTSPANNSSLVATVPVALKASATTAQGTITKVEFYDGSTKLGDRTAPDGVGGSVFSFTQTAGFSVGSHTLTARAISSTGASATSAAVSITAGTYTGAPEALILTPDEDARISAPVKVTGVVAHSALTAWALDYRLKAPEGDSPEAWVTFATGSNLVGTPASGTSPAIAGELGTFDPTLLLNGIYEIRLRVTDSSNTTLTAGPITVVVEGNMKVGAFTLAFEDLKLPLPGIPLTITRTYDSRDARVGDFGPAWRIAVANVRVQKNRNLGAAWWQTPQSGNGIQFYYVEPIRERIVTITMPDGETHRFRAGAYVKNRSGDPDNASFAVVVRTGKIKFYPLGDTTSTLEPLDATGALADDFWIAGTGDQDVTAEDPVSNPFAAPFNPTRFRLTTKDGTRYLVDERLGLLELRDLNGNSLVVNRDAQNRVSAVVSTQAAPSGAIVSTVTIHRDATGRVDYIRDPAGKDLDYLYDAQGRLGSFTNREGNTTQFRYENPTFPHYLTRIIDPRGIAALRSEFDANGRLVKQIDADGRETVFDRGLDVTGRFEKVTDRLGKTSTFYYDDRGNVTLKIDPLGAHTSFTYYADSDRVRTETDHYGNVRSMAYDAQGNVVATTTGASASEDPAHPTTGHTTWTIYNARSAPTQITDPDGRVQTFGYDPATNNLLTHTIGAGGSAPSTTTYTYKTDGTLDTITDALGNVTSHTFNYAFSDAAYPGAVKEVALTVTDPAGAGGSDPANASATVLRFTRSLYDAQENLLASIARRTLPEGGTEDVVTRYRYDAENRLVATIQPDGKVAETRYTSFGQTDQSLLWRSVADFQSGNDALARITRYTYDARGNQTIVTHPDGATETSSFDLENRREWTEDALGHRTSFQYDDAGRLRFTIQPDATPATTADNPYTETVYDLAGRVTDTYDELRHRTRVTYYPDGAPDGGRRKESIQVLATGNLVTTYQYDASGNVRFVTDPRGNTVETRYDDHGRPTTVVYPATDEHPSTQTLTTFNALGQRIVATDQEGKDTRYRYDGLGRLVEVRQYLDQSLAAGDAAFALAPTATGVVSTRYAYDEAGNQLAQTDARGNTTSYRHDALGRRVKRTLPDAAYESLQYDEWGNLWKRTDFKGYTTTFLYDARNRLTEKRADPSHPSLIYSHAPDKITFGYDAAGNRTDATVEKGSTVLYAEDTPVDARNRRAYKDTALGRLTYGYFANGQLKSITSSNGDGVKLAFRYDDANRLAYVDDSSALSAPNAQPATTAYTYNANGSLETVTAPNTVVHTYGYDALNRLRTLNIARGTTSLHSYEYQLRASGHRHQIVENGTRTTTLDYDSLHRLTGETITGDAHGNNGAVSYGLDKVGNRLERVSQVSALSSQLSLSYNARDWLAGDTYDANGNTLTSSLTAYGAPLTTADVYDFEDRLIIRRKPDGTTVNLSYDADGILRQKTVFNSAATLVSATGYFTDTANPTGYAQVLEERSNTASGTTVKLYAYGHDLISQSTSLNSQPSTLNYFAYDGLASVRELTDVAGGVTDAYDYDAFGNTLRRVGTTTNDYLYRGERFDSDLGQYYLRARFYNQATGRFWNEDAYEGSAGDPVSLHKYLYANGNPVSGFDPSGHDTLAGLNIGNAVRGIVFTIAVVAVAKFAPSIADVGGGLAEESDALGRAVKGLAMSAAAAAIFEYQSLHDQVEKAAKDMAEELKKKLRRLKVVPISFSMMPKVAQHVQDAQGGPLRPQLLTRTTSAMAKQNRRDAIAGRGPAGDGQSWDEYPFASTVQGGTGASVRAVPLRENLIQGGVIAASYAIQGIKPGDEFFAVVIP